MSHDLASEERPLIELPRAALAATALGAIITSEGKSAEFSASEGLKRLAGEPHLVCHAPYTVERLALIANEPREMRRAAMQVRHFDVAELFLFVRPAQFAVPTPRGMARALGVKESDDAKALQLSRGNSSEGPQRSRLSAPAGSHADCRVSRAQQLAMG